MKVKDFIMYLERFNPELDIILSKDSEGNGFSPLHSVTHEMYIAESTWSGELATDDYENFKFNSIVLWPIN